MLLVIGLLEFVGLGLRTPTLPTYPYSQTLGFATRTPAYELEFVALYEKLVSKKKKSK
jgi:hypothetical protein